MILKPQHWPIRIVKIKHTVSKQYDRRSTLAISEYSVLGAHRCWDGYHPYASSLLIHNLLGYVLDALFASCWWYLCLSYGLMFDCIVEVIGALARIITDDTPLSLVLHTKWSVEIVAESVTSWLESFRLLASIVYRPSPLTHFVKMSLSYWV